MVRTGSNMSKVEQAAVAFCYRIDEPNRQTAFADQGKATLVGRKAESKPARSYPEDRGMPAPEALKAYGVQDISRIELLD